jgi:preprotein translocase subunit SecE
MAMNREQRRLLQRQGQLDAEGNPIATRREQRTPPPKERRASPPEFLREVRGELRKVAWPTRREVAHYTVVVLITVVVMTGFIYLLDLVFGELIYELLRAGT